MRKKIITIAIAVVILVAGAAIWWLFDTKRLVFQEPTTDGQVYSVNTVDSNLCGEGIVNKYNDAMYYKVRSGSSTPTIDETGVSNLVKEVKAIPGYENDPTCQTIIFWDAVRNDDYKSARNAYNNLTSLHNKRLFVDSNLRSDQPLFMYEETLKGLTGSGFSEADVVGN